MDTNVLLTIATIFVGMITTMMVGLLPWIYKINGRLTRIEVQLEFFKEHWGRVADEDA